MMTKFIGFCKAKVEVYWKKDSLNYFVQINKELRKVLYSNIHHQYCNIKRFFIFTDIDECTTNPCHADGTCTNTPGTFQCACNQGYSGNGLVCLST